MMTDATSRPSTLARLLLPLLVTTLLLGGCKEQAPQSNAETIPATIEAEAPKAEEGFRVVDEVYGDPEIFAQPRIQFLWESPENAKGRQSRREVWSINLDGSDLRRAVPFKLINGNVWYAVRSPDNRYMAMAVDVGERYEKRLVDLKTMTVKMFSYGGTKPAFHWSRDSRTLYFNEDGLFKQYHLPSDEVTEITRFGMGGNNVLLFDNDTKIVLFKPTAYTINRMSDGKELRRVEMPKGSGIGAERVAMSLDEQYIFFDGQGSEIHSLVNPDERYNLQRTHPFFFSPVEKGEMYYGLRTKRNFYTGERHIPKGYLLPDGGGSAGRLTLINTRVLQGDQG